MEGGASNKYIPVGPVKWAICLFLSFQVEMKQKEKKIKSY